MTNYVMTHGGSHVLRLLELDCGMTAPEALAFLKARAGEDYDPNALYSIRFPSGQHGANWAKYDRLRISKLSEHQAKMWHMKAEREERRR